MELSAYIFNLRRPAFACARPAREPDGGAGQTNETPRCVYYVRHQRVCFQTSYSYGSEASAPRGGAFIAPLAARTLPAGFGRRCFPRRIITLFAGAITPPILGYVWYKAWLGRRKNRALARTPVFARNDDSPYSYYLLPRWDNICAPP